MPSARQIDAELLSELRLESIDIPLVGMSLLRQMLFENVLSNVRDVVLDDQLLLIEAFEKLTAQPVDGLALLVHHVVVFEQVLAGFEVLRLDCLLCGLDAIEIMRDSMGTPSSMPICCSSVETHSFAKMRIRSSSSDR